MLRLTRLAFVFFVAAPLAAQASSPPGQIKLGPVANTCMNALGGVKEGAPIGLWGCKEDGGPNSAFSFEGTKLMVGGLCLTSPDGRYVVARHCGKGELSFKVDGKLIKTPDNKCLDAEEGKTGWGTKVVIWPCHGDGNQQWEVPGRHVAIEQPAPPPPAAAGSSWPREHDRILGRWRWKFPDDNSIWGPEIVEFRTDGVAAFSRDKIPATWQRDGEGKYSVKWANGNSCVLTVIDRDHLDGLVANGMIVKPERDIPPPPEAAPAPPPPAPVAIAPPPPPPPPVEEGNASRMIKTNKRVYRKGEPVVVSYFGMPGNATDWTNVAKADAANDDWGDWENNSGADGQRTVKNLGPGAYEARAYFNGSTNLEDKVAFTVVP